VLRNKRKNSRGSISSTNYHPQEQAVLSYPSNMKVVNEIEGVHVGDGRRNLTRFAESIHKEHNNLTKELSSLIGKSASKMEQELAIEKYYKTKASLKLLPDDDETEKRNRKL
jgi:predicted outer membrane protein